MSVVTDAELKRLIFESQPPLVAPCTPEQVQPDGVELTLAEVGVWQGPGALAFDNGARIIPEVAPLPADNDGWWVLPPGGYAISFRETVNIPDDLCALARPRSSLLRMGAAVHTALWDSGYAGRSRALLAVFNPAGIRVRLETRLIQLVFLRITAPPGQGYRGAYQGEV